VPAAGSRESWAARFDVKGFHADPGEPVANGMGGKLGAIVGTDVIGRTMALEQLCQYGEHIITLDLTLHMDRQTLAAVLVDHGRHLERFTVMGTISNKVVAPDVATILRPQPHA